MDLRDYIRALRRHLWLIIATTVVLTLLAVAAAMLLPRQYEADSQVFVSVRGQDTDQLLQGSSFSQQRVKSYAETMSSPLVLDPVIEELGLDISAADLAEKHLSTTVPLDTVLIDLTVTDGDPQRAADIANAVTEQFITEVQQLEGESEGSSPVQVTVTREAIVDDRPSSPNVPLLLVLGAGVGLVLGAALAVLRQVTDTLVRNPDDARPVTGLPVIGGIPQDKEADRSPLVVHGNRHSVRAEAFRSLRTNLQFVEAAHRARTIVFTSSVPGEGKSSTTANLAVALADSGARVCIIEADLRRPRLTAYLDLMDGAGLTSVLIGEAEAEDVLQQSRDNVWAIGSGPIPPNPSELLSSPRMATLLRELEETFDHVIIDAPPLLPVTDAAVLAQVADGVVVVVGAGMVRREHLRRTLSQLESVDATVLGLVMNRVSQKDQTYGTYTYRTEPTSRGRLARRSGRRG